MGVGGASLFLGARQICLKKALRLTTGLGRGRRPDAWAGGGEAVQGALGPLRARPRPRPLAGSPAALQACYDSFLIHVKRVYAFVEMCSCELS